MHDDEVGTDAALVRALLAGQFRSGRACPSSRSSRAAPIMPSTGSGTGWPRGCR
jgi:hypothetical protein